MKESQYRKNGGINSANNYKRNFRIQDFIPLYYVYTIISVILVIVVINISNFLYHKDVQVYKDKRYDITANEIIKDFDSVYKDQFLTTQIIAKNIAKNKYIHNAILKKNSSIINKKLILEDLSTEKEYQNYKIKVLDSDGNVFFKSWIDLDKKDTYNKKPFFSRMKENPQIQTELYTNRGGLFIVNRVPIYDNQNFIGICILYSSLDKITDHFINQDLKTIIVLNSEDSQKVYQNQSFSKTFVDNFYIANFNADPYLVRIIKQNDVSRFYEKWKKNYSVSHSIEHLVTKYDIKNSNDEIIAQSYIFKLFEDIDLTGIELIEDWYIIVTLIIILVAIFYIYYMYTSNRITRISKKNKYFVVENERLTEMAALLDYNEKKIENLFNSQPNLMMMHNGSEVTQGNKRFLGFFHRFKSFNGFKKENKCISELFERYEYPNYIWDQYIDGLYWIDYILKNPKRIYKTVISTENREMVSEPHHFIIKVNEISFNSNINERVIVIAFVDMTQDISNYKSLEISSQFGKM